MNRRLETLLMVLLQNVTLHTCPWLEDAKHLNDRSWWGYRSCQLSWQLGQWKWADSWCPAAVTFQWLALDQQALGQVTHSSLMSLPFWHWQLTWGLMSQNMSKLSADPVFVQNMVNDVLCVCVHLYMVVRQWAAGTQGTGRKVISLVKVSHSPGFRLN